MKFKLFIILVLFLSQTNTRKLKKNPSESRFGRKECYLICKERFYGCLEATALIEKTDLMKIYNQSLYCKCFDQIMSRWRVEIRDYPFVMTNEGSSENPIWICE